MSHPKVLFILKKRHLYNLHHKDYAMNSGLLNSAQFVNKMLQKNGVWSELVQVNDNNDIDREVSKHRPTHVIIEALWVVPDKFKVLHNLHPHVNWIIRIHSEIPFIANEGVAMEWLFKYSQEAEELKIHIAPNSIKMLEDLRNIGIKNLIYLPNYYPVNHHHKFYPFDTNHEWDAHNVNIGCFGAIRPMKNQLIQAIAAIEFGNEIDKTIHFHINAERIEKGENALKNIRALFENQKRHKLVEHPWYNHEDFLDIVSKMDLGMQVSFNETFNIVAADFVSLNVPFVGSKEIPWLSCLYQADATSTSKIVNKLKFAYAAKPFGVQKLNRILLTNACEEAQKVWLKRFENHKNRL